MAQSKAGKTTRKAAPKAKNQASGDNVIWIFGFVLLVSGVFSFISTLSHFFSWSEDVSAIAGGVNPAGNLFGDLGAYIGYGFVDGSFGIFGLLLAAAMVFFGWQIVLRREMHLWYVSLCVGLLLVVGSTTMGYISYLADTTFPWGGDWGRASAEWLNEIMQLGVILVLIFAWGLTGIVINSNLINFLSGVARKVESGVGNIASKITSSTEEETEVDEDAEEAEDTDDEKTPTPPKPAVVAGKRPIKDVNAKLGDEIAIVAVEDDDTKAEEPQKIVGDDVPQKEIDREKLLGTTDDNEEQFIIVSDDDDNPVQKDIEPEDISDKSVDTDKAAAEDEVDEDGIVIKVYTPTHKEVDEEDVEDDLYNPLLDLKSYRKPDVRILEDYHSTNKVSDEEILENKHRIEETLLNFGIPIVDINATVGPTITLYEIVQAQGVKIAKIQGLEKDIAQSLKSLGIRIIAPIPGRGTIGIEVPNRDKQIVSMRSSILSPEFQESKAQLPVVIGRTIQNKSYVFDLAKLPHLLVAGATGQGKSVGLNAIIASLLYRKHPAELKFVLIDPKMVEFPIYSKIERHFLAKMESEEDPIVTDPKRAVCVLNSLVMEMENRLQLCKMATTRNIVEYNEKFIQRKLNPNNGHRFMPYIVVIIDEFADLIMMAKDVEAPVMRLAQKARAVGIHLIVATQRPDVKVITGGIKANFPSRIAFRVMQMVDSKTIIDQPGANQLIGRGDMLFSKDGELTRIQCALIDTPEITRLVDSIAEQQGYTEAYMLPEYSTEGSGDGGYGGGDSGSDGESGKAVKYDAKYAEIARDIVANGRFSISSIQQTHEVGFNRAARIVRQLERDGIVGPQIGSKPREIKYYDLPSLEAKLQELGLF